MVCVNSESLSIVCFQHVTWGPPLASGTAWGCPVLVLEDGEQEDYVLQKAGVFLF